MEHPIRLPLASVCQFDFVFWAHPNNQVHLVAACCFCRNVGPHVVYKLFHFSWLGSYFTLIHLAIGFPAQFQETCISLLYVLPNVGTYGNKTPYTEP